MSVILAVSLCSMLFVDLRIAKDNAADTTETVDADLFTLDEHLFPMSCSGVVLPLTRTLTTMIAVFLLCRCRFKELAVSRCRCQCLAMVERWRGRMNTFSGVDLKVGGLRLMVGEGTQHSRIDLAVGGA